MAADQNNEYFSLYDEMKIFLEAVLDIEVIIKTVLYSQYHDAIATEDFTIAMNNWVGDFEDPMAFLQMWMYKNEKLGHYYDNESYRAILEESFILDDPSERRLVLQAAEQLLLEEAIVIPIYHLFAVELVRNDKIRNWYPNLLNSHNLTVIQSVPLQDNPSIIRNPMETPKTFHRHI